MPRQKLVRSLWSPESRDGWAPAYRQGELAPLPELEPCESVRSVRHMSTTEIVAELPRLSAQERAEIFTQLWQLEESVGPAAHEKTLLNEAQADFDANP